jgi:hypothetical protein
VNTKVRFPEMRENVLAAVEALGDPVYQSEKWGHYFEDINYYDDLDLNIHILYDDCMVLPTPERAVPQILYEDEVLPLRALDAVLGPMIDDLGDVTYVEYIVDPRWAGVVGAARDAYLVMLANDRRAEAG